MKYVQNNSYDICEVQTRGAVVGNLIFAYLGYSSQSLKLLVYDRYSAFASSVPSP